MLAQSYQLWPRQPYGSQGEGERHTAGRAWASCPEGCPLVPGAQTLPMGPCMGPTWRGGRGLRAVSPRHLIPFLNVCFPTVIPF